MGLIAGQIESNSIGWNAAYCGNIWLVGYESKEMLSFNVLLNDWLQLN